MANWPFNDCGENDRMHREIFLVALASASACRNSCA